jgi:hypothetical protein
MKKKSLVAYYSDGLLACSPLLLVFELDLEGRTTTPICMCMGIEEEPI